MSDAWTRFTGQLPHWLALQVHETDAAHDALLRAMANGWQLDRLASECSRDLADASSPGAVVISRLRELARWRPLPEQPASKAKGWQQPLPWCGQCDDPRTRWVETSQGKLTRCPRCWTEAP